jgi:four helix bundle protein
MNAILDRPGLRRDRDLREQIEDANDSVDANMQEGFEQPTDAAFANFVFISKGSAAEVVARLQEAHRKGQIAAEDLAPIERMAEPLGKMMGGFIKYLCASGFTDRGRHTVAPRPRKPAKPPRRRRRR